MSFWKGVLEFVLFILISLIIRLSFQIADMFEHLGLSIIISLIGYMMIYTMFKVWFNERVLK